MRLLVLGATGGTGRAVVEQGLAAGHRVTALARAPERLPVRHDALEGIRGDVTSPDDLARAAAGCDAVISALGVAGRAPTTLYSASARAAIEAMRRTGVGRLVVVSAGAHVRDPAYPRVFRWVVQPLLLRVLAGPYADMARMEAEVARSGLRWTIVRPARLTDRPPAGRYRLAAPGIVPGGWLLSRGDLAAFLLRCAAEDRHVGEAVSIAD